MVGVRIENAFKAFGDIRAVDDVTLEIEKGEFFFLLGPSGCGKTTLLRIVAGFYFPDRGRILFDGRDMTGVAPNRRNTGMVFQNYALWPHMTVRANLSFGLEVRRIPENERRRRVDRALEIVRLVDLGDRFPNQLSGGQQQRVAVARALVMEPDVVLMDEPLSNLDAKLRLELREQIRGIHEELGVTIIYVTHDQQEALSMADRVALMDQGKIVQTGRPRDIYHCPANRFVADFMGDSNLFEGRITAIGETCSVQTKEGELHAVCHYAKITVGDPVWCLLRPESLEIVDPGERRTNTFEGEVAATLFLGSHEQYSLRTATGHEIKVVEHRTKQALAMRGRKARVGCTADDVVVLPRRA